MFYPKIFTGRPLLRVTIYTLPFIALLSGCSLNVDSQGRVTVNIGSNNNGFNLCDASVVDQTFERDLPSAPNGIDIGASIHADFKGKELVNKAKVTVSGIQPADVKLVVVDGRLVIAGKENCSYSKIDATVSSKSPLKFVNISTSARLTDNSNTAEIVGIRASTSSRVDITTPNVTSAGIVSDTSARINLKAELNDLRLESSDSALTSISSVNTAVVDLSNSAKLDVGNLKVGMSGNAINSSRIDVGGSGIINVTTENSARIKKY
jgi:hypothetical protein